MAMGGPPSRSEGKGAAPQRASVEPSEVTRYEEYDAKHGAKYIDPAADAAMDDDDWGT